MSRIIRFEALESKEDGGSCARPMSVVDELMADDGDPWGGLSEHDYMEVLQVLEETVRRELDVEGPSGVVAVVAVVVGGGDVEVGLAVVDIKNPVSSLF